MPRPGRTFAVEKPCGRSWLAKGMAILVKEFSSNISGQGSLQNLHETPLLRALRAWFHVVVWRSIENKMMKTTKRKSDLIINYIYTNVPTSKTNIIASGSGSLCLASGRGSVCLQTSSNFCIAAEPFGKAKKARRHHRKLRQRRWQRRWHPERSLQIRQSRSALVWARLTLVWARLTCIRHIRISASHWRA